MGEMIKCLRGQIVERERAQQQIAILSGGTIAAAASVLVRTHVSVWIILALSILLIGFAFAMLHNDDRIITLASFIVKQDGEDAESQRAWERHLLEHGRHAHGMKHVILMLRAVAAYAVPMLGSLGVLVVFFVKAGGYQLTAASVPLVLYGLFVRGALDVGKGFRGIAEGGTN